MGFKPSPNVPAQVITTVERAQIVGTIYDIDFPLTISYLKVVIPCITRGNGDRMNIKINDGFGAGFGVMPLSGTMAVYNQTSVTMSAIASSGSAECYLSQNSSTTIEIFRIDTTSMILKVEEIGLVATVRSNIILFPNNGIVKAVRLQHGMSVTYAKSLIQYY
jgi:hypothetical protein